VGLGRLAVRIFRIGQLGWFNDLTLCGTLCGVEMGLAACAVPYREGGVGDALAYLREPVAAGEALRDAITRRVA
jgi:alanine-glyoxylate transaminase/serine-glyoxylate transaminase/serine-pyruvate transaminase